MGRLLLLLAVNALLALAVVQLAATPADVAPRPPDRRPEPSAAGTGDSGEDVLPELADLDRNQVITRPLFAPGRRPWQAPQTPQPADDPGDDQAAVEAPPELTLLGVAIANGKGRALILDATSGSDAVWVTEGETIAGYTLAEVSGGSARLQRDGESIPLELYPSVGVPQ